MYVQGLEINNNSVYINNNNNNINSNTSNNNVPSSTLNQNQAAHSSYIISQSTKNGKNKILFFQKKQ